MFQPVAGSVIPVAWPSRPTACLIESVTVMVARCGGPMAMQHGQCRLKTAWSCWQQRRQVSWSGLVYAGPSNLTSDLTRMSENALCYDASNIANCTCRLLVFASLMIAIVIINQIPTYRVASSTSAPRMSWVLLSARARPLPAVTNHEPHLLCHLQ